jgi:c(7)-type cytochrome triheme protein
MRAGERRAPFLALFALALAAGCGKAAAVFLDLPEEQPQPATTSATPAPGRATSALQELARPRPPIEGTLDPDSVLALLPRDKAGNIDWVAALRSGVIAPRRVLPGEEATAPPRFDFNFYFKGFDAYFPHSAHVEWLNCESCHPTVYRYRGESTTMAAIEKGESCGLCHRTVAFPAATCERCHSALPMPEGRMKPKLEDDVVLARVGEPSAMGVTDTSFPPARFPHWVHRIRYQCSACHPTPFQMRAGSARITMADLDGGQACGRCHNSRAAFGLFECDRCHRAVKKKNDSKP